MTRKLAGSIAGLAFCLAAVPAWAHHSFAAEFDPNKPVKLKGTVTEMEWINPHSWIHMDVKGADGKVVSWMVEGGSPNALLRRGFTKNSLPAGTRDRDRRLSGQGWNESRKRPRYNVRRRQKTLSRIVRQRRARR